MAGITDFDHPGQGRCEGRVAESDATHLSRGGADTAGGDLPTGQASPIVLLVAVLAVQSSQFSFLVAAERGADPMP